MTTIIREKGMKFDAYEQEIIDAIANDELVPMPEAKFAKRKEEVVQYAQNTIAKKKAINIRISELDLLRLKAKAAQEGLPYQTMISSILHKVADQVKV